MLQRRWQALIPIKLFIVKRVDLCLRAMKVDEAASNDGIETEHLPHAHPILWVMLRMLFNLR